MIEKAFFILANSKLLRIKSSFKRRNWARFIVAMVTLGLMGLVAGAVSAYSYFVFKFLGSYSEFKQPIIVYSLAATFFLTSVLTFFSSLITALSSLFQRDDNILLFSWPVSYSAIFELRTIDTIVLANWPLFIFSLPVIFGYSFALEISFLTMVLFALGTMFLNLTAAFGGILLAMLLSYRWGNLKSKLVSLVLLLAIPLAGWGFIRLLLPSALTQDLGPFSLGEIGQLLNRQAILSPLLPSTWIVNFVYYWPTNHSFGLINWYFMVILLGIILIIIWHLRNSFFIKTVDKSYVGRFIAAPWDIVKKKAKPFPYFLRGKMGALTEKDWLVVFRSSPQVFQLGFLVFLQLIYFLIIARIPAERFRQVFGNSLEIKISSLNFLFINFMACVFSMRYFFPMISLEGQSSWIIWSSPIKRMKIFWQKYFSSFIVLLTWMCLSTLISINLLNLKLVQGLALIFLNFPIALTITMITLGIGTLRPNFWEKNPEKLSTSPGGILATVLCLGYIGLIGFLLFFSKNIPGKVVVVQISAWITSGLISFPLLYSIPKAINHYEV